MKIYWVCVTLTFDLFCMKMGLSVTGMRGIFLLALVLDLRDQSGQTDGQDAHSVQRMLLPIEKAI